MRFFFSNYDFKGLLEGLRARGHEIVSEGEWGRPLEQCPDSWWHGFHHRLTPEEYGHYLLRRLEEERADVFVLGKGFHWRENGQPWCVPPAVLFEMSRRGILLAWLSWDDPDCTPQAIGYGILPPMHAIGTCCWDEQRTLRPYRATAPRARVFLFWPGWDQAEWEPTIAEPVEETCDLLIGGSPYLKPTDEYRGPPRREIAWEAIRRGWKVEIWGGREWLLEAHGGDARLAPYYLGPYGYRERGRLWRRARLNVDTHLRYGPRGYLNDRFFQVGGSGRALVCDDQPGVADAFPEVVYFRAGDMGDLFGKLEELRGDAGMRAALGAAFRARVLAQHTLAHRADALLAALGIS